MNAEKRQSFRFSTGSLCNSAVIVRRCGIYKDPSDLRTDIEVGIGTYMQMSILVQGSVFSYKVFVHRFPRFQAVACLAVEADGTAACRYRRQVFTDFTGECDLPFCPARLTAVVAASSF